jgi:hypothetical protein
MDYFSTRDMPPFPSGRRDAARRHLELVVAGSAAQPRRPRRPVLVASGVAVTVLATGACAFAIAGHQAVTDKSFARCYTVASLSTSRYTTIAQAGTPGQPQPQIDNALSVCADLFRQGYLTPGGPGTNPHPDGKFDHPVPRLVECTMADGTAAVFPGGPGTCASVGLPTATRGRS